MDIIVGSIGHSGDEYQNQINTEGHDIKEQMQKEVTKPETLYDAVSSQGDTLSISEKGKAVSAKLMSLQEEESSDDGIVIKKSVNEEQAEKPQTNNLSSYTKTELQQIP